MPANTSPIFTAAPNFGAVTIPTTNAVTKSDGASSGSGTDAMYCAFKAGSNGSFLDRIQVHSVASSANTTGVLTTLRIFLSSVSTTLGSAAGATTNADTFLLREVVMPAIASDVSTTANTFLELSMKYVIPTGYSILVCQHVAQTTNQSLQIKVFGGDY